MKKNRLSKITLGVGVLSLALMTGANLVSTKAYATGGGVSCNCGAIWGNGCFADNYGAYCASVSCAGVTTNCSPTKP